MNGAPKFSVLQRARPKGASFLRAARAWRSHSLGSAAVFFVAIIAAEFVHAEGPQTLLRQYKCYICHSDTQAGAGPAYVDVAEKYRGNKDAVKILVAEVRKGAHGGGPWHMPPHPEVSYSDAVTMVRYILARKR
jgi:cytochrome c